MQTTTVRLAGRKLTLPRKLAITGPNGSGKTGLLHELAGQVGHVVWLPLSVEAAGIVEHADPGSATAARDALLRVMPLARFAPVRGEQSSRCYRILLGLYSSSAPSLLLLDSAERGLHPDSQQELMEEVDAVTTARAGISFACTAVEPYVLSNFRLDEVLVVNLDSHGEQHAKLLEEYSGLGSLYSLHPELFLRLAGSDWVLKDCG